MPQETTYTARFSSPDWIQRAITQTIECPVYRDGALVAPDGGGASTVSVYDADGAAIVDEQSATITNSIATYSIADTVIPATLALSDRWRVVWSLSMASIGFTFTRSAGLVRRRLYPVVTDADLTRLHTELRAWMAEDATSLQGYIDAAWDDISQRLIEDGRWPFLILSPSSLRAAHVALSLHMAFLDYASSAGGAAGKYDALATHYAAKFEGAWDRLKMVYDFSDDGLIADDEQGVAAYPVIMTVNPGRWRWRWDGGQ